MVVGPDRWGRPGTTALRLKSVRVLRMGLLIDGAAGDGRAGGA